MHLFNEIEQGIQIRHFNGRAHAAHFVFVAGLLDDRHERLAEQITVAEILEGLVE